jgi:carbon-monoxide dehydrogenase medium subunit
MKFFEYAEPTSLQETAELLQSCAGTASLMAGGTDLLVMMKEHVRAPSHVVNIKKIPGLDDFSFTSEGGLCLGALVTTRQIETSDIALKHYASLAKACTDFASIQVRNRATLVGNVCRASPSADSLPPLIADGAVLHIYGTQGQRQCRVEDFLQGRGAPLWRPMKSSPISNFPPLLSAPARSTSSMAGAARWSWPPSAWRSA